MRKYILILALFILLSSCTPDNGGSSSGSNWRTGTEGIVFSYMPDNPPSEVLSSGRVRVLLKYSNKGAQTTSPYFYLTGYDPKILAFGNPSVRAPSIEGKSIYNPQGSQEEYVEWSASISMSSLQYVDSFKQGISVTACYPYKTIAYPSICIDPFKYTYDSAAGCDYSVKDLGSSQGAPIVVTKVSQKSTGDEIFLEINFQNKGKGTPYITDSSCLNLKHTDVDVIYLESVTMPEGAFTCEPRNIRLVNNNGFTICRRPLTNKNNYYESQVQISVRYNYRDTIPKKDISIINVNRR
jgi:hypothetical protein